MQEDDGGRSFLEHMAKAGNDPVGLTNYANLMYAGLAKVPVGPKRVVQFMADLLPYVSRCNDCGEPMGNWLKPECECGDCGDLYANFCMATEEALQRHRNTGFCCLQYEGLPYRKPWQQAGREAFYAQREGA